MEREGDVERMEEQQEEENDYTLEAEDPPVNAREPTQNNQPNILPMLQQQIEQKAQMQQMLFAMIERPQQPTTSVRPKLNTYDGTTEYTLFKVQFDLAATQFRWTEQDKTMALAQALTGKAVRAIDQLNTTNKPVTYTNLDATLQKLFVERKTLSDRQHEYLTLRQQPGQTIKDFAQTIEEKARAFMLHSPEADIQASMLDVFRTSSTGLMDQESAKILSLVPLTTMDEAVICLNSRSRLQRQTDGASPKKIRKTQTVSESKDVEKESKPIGEIRVIQINSETTGTSKGIHTYPYKRIKGTRSIRHHVEVDQAARSAVADFRTEGEDEVHGEIGQVNKLQHVFGADPCFTNRPTVRKTNNKTGSEQIGSSNTQSHLADLRTSTKLL